MTPLCPPSKLRLARIRALPVQASLASLALALFTTPPAAGAAELPQPSTDDPRVRLVRYATHQVTLVKVRRGTVTRITLAPQEQIEVAVTGLTARCDKDEDAWCIRADVGGNQVFVRPKDGAKRNNLELRSNLRDYSIEFEVLPDAAGGRPGEPFFRVAYQYDPPARPAAAASGTDPTPARQATLRAIAAVEALQNHAAALRSTGDPQAAGLMPPAERLSLAPPAVRNGHYSLQVLDRGEDATPSLVFDDGRFTYFEFAGAREIPAIFAHGSDGAPTRVNWHMQGNLVVVERTARRFTLRLGDAVAGVFNEAFDPVGLETPSGTVSTAVRRILRDKP